MPRKYTEARAASNKKWDSVNLWRKSVAFPAADREVIESHAAAAGRSVNAYILEAVRARIQGEPEPPKR